jgi:hypothetical protein
VARLLQKFNVEEVVEDLKNLEEFKPLEYKKFLEEAIKNPEKFELSLKIVPTFSSKEKKRQISLLQDIEELRFEESERKEKYPIEITYTPLQYYKKEKKGYCSGEIKINAIYQRYSIKELIPYLFFILKSEAIQYASEVSVSFEVGKIGERKEKIKENKLKPITDFGGLTRENEGNIKTLIDFYSTSPITEIIFSSLHERNALVECLVEQGEPEKVRYEDVKKPLEFREINDVVEKVKGFKRKFKYGEKIFHAGAFYTSVDKRGKDSPDIIFIEAEPGELLQIYDEEKSWELNTKVCQEILNILKEIGIKCVCNYSGSKSYHLILGIREEQTSIPESYKKLLEELEWKKERREWNLYGFATIFVERIGYEVSKRLEKKYVKIISIDPSRKQERYSKILIDSSSNKEKGVFAVPATLRLSTTRCCKRIGLDDYKLPFYCWTKKEIVELSERENIIKDVKENEELYYTLPRNDISIFEKDVRENEKKYFLQLWIRKKIEKEQHYGRYYPKDRVLNLTQQIEENLLSHYLKR